MHVFNSNLIATWVLVTLESSKRKTHKLVLTALFYSDWTHDKHRLVLVGYSLVFATDLITFHMNSYA